MYAQIETPKENKSRAIADSVAQKKSEVKQGFGFVDSRPDETARTKLQKTVNNSEKATKTIVDIGITTNNLRWDSAPNVASPAKTVVVQARWVDQSGNELPPELMSQAEINLLDAFLRAGQRAGFGEAAESLQLRLEGLNGMGMSEPLVKVFEWVKERLNEKNQPYTFEYMFGFLLQNLVIPDDSLINEVHEDDLGPGNAEEELENGNLELADIPESDQHQIAQALVQRHPELYETFKELANGYHTDSKLFLHWYNLGVLTRNQFKNFLQQQTTQLARTPGTESYQVTYNTDNFGTFNDVTYKRDGLGSIAFDVPMKYKKWSNPISPGSEVQLNTGSTNKTHGITLSGRKIKIAGASRGQHFSIANRIANNHCGSSSPNGWTWHHLTTDYKMVLVDRTVHAKHGHNGGVYVWK